MRLDTLHLVVTLKVILLTKALSLLSGIFLEKNDRGRGALPICYCEECKNNFSTTYLLITPAVLHK